VVCGSFFGGPAGAVLLLNGAGMCYMNTPDVLLIFSQALTVACGPTAEALADIYPAPVDTTRSSPTPETAELAARAAAEYQATQTDGMRLARWACENCPDQPERWARRAVWLRYEAGLFVRAHALEIVRVATDLFVRGFVHHQSHTWENLEVFTMQAMAEIEQQQQQQARERFVGAVWAGATAADLYDLAKTTGLRLAKADELVREVRALQALASEADELDARRRKASKATEAHRDLEARNRPEIERLEGEIEASAGEADVARQRMNSAEQAGRDLLRAAAAGLVPAESLPKPARALQERLGRRAEADERDAKRVQLGNTVNDRRQAVVELEHELRELPLSRDEKPQRADLERRLKAAKAALADSQTEQADHMRAKP